MSVTMQIDQTAGVVICVVEGDASAEDVLSATDEVQTTRTRVQNHHAAVRQFELALARPSSEFQAVRGWIPTHRSISGMLNIR